jgi:hypothetical protein
LEHSDENVVCEGDQHSGTDPDAGVPLTYSLLTGAASLDAAFFDINASTGVLSFKIAPDFENPSDSDQNNSYIVQVSVADNGSPTLSDTQTITVNVTNAQFLGNPH